MLPSRPSSRGYTNANGGSGSGGAGSLLQRIRSGNAQRRLLLGVLALVFLSALLLLHLTGRGDGDERSGETPPAQLSSRDELSLARTAPVLTAASGSSAAAAEADKRRPGYINLEPPLSRATLGHASWSLLHTMAALYPDAPSLAKQASMRAFLDALGELYPCAMCARHFRAYLRAHPLPSPLDGPALRQWLCEAHNDVNRRTDKPLFDCALIDQKWPHKLQQDCGCDEEEKTAEEASATQPGAEGAAPSAAAADLDPAALAAAIERDRIGALKAAQLEEEEAEQERALQRDEEQKRIEQAALKQGLPPPTQQQAEAPSVSEAARL